MLEEGESRIPPLLFSYFLFLAHPTATLALYSEYPTSIFPLVSISSPPTHPLNWMEWDTSGEKEVEVVPFLPNIMTDFSTSEVERVLILNWKFFCPFVQPKMNLNTQKINISERRGCLEYRLTDNVQAPPTHYCNNDNYDGENYNYNTTVSLPQFPNPSHTCYFWCQYPPPCHTPTSPPLTLIYSLWRLQQRQKPWYPYSPCRWIE